MQSTTNVFLIMSCLIHMLQHCTKFMLLALILLLSGRTMASQDELEPDSEFPTQTVSRLHFPHVKVGPYNWQYFRVTVPHGFQKLRIELTKLWHSGKVNQNGVLNPLICFRLAAPPSPTAALPSVEQATIAAGQPESISKTGNCAVFSNSTTVNLDNEQVIAGEWHIGMFSNAQPTRFQSKMISRGPVYTFSLRLSAFGCGSPTLTGKHCNLTINQLCSGDQEFNAHAHGSMQTPTVSPDEDEWNTLRNQRFGASQWKYYSLHVAEFATSLEFQVKHSSSSRRALNIFVRFGALPEKIRNVSETDNIHIPVPYLGWWYIAVFNSEESSQDQSFSLLWKLQSCARDEPRWALIQLERALQETAFESPFDSFFTLSEKGFESPPSEWFPFKGENWSYFTFEIPRGIAGATLTLEIRNVPTSLGAELYMRHQGLPTLKHHDFHTKSWESSKFKSEMLNDGVALINMMFPLEGTWCIRVRVGNGDQLLAQKYNIVEQAPPYVERIVHLDETEFGSTVAESNISLFYAGGNITTNSELDSVGAVADQEVKRNKVNEEFESVLSASNVRSENNFPQMRLVVHGCLNSCSSHGSCQTTHDSSRIYQYSYCHCDNTHGGDDCSVVLLPANEEMIHIWALVGSNFAAIMPSLWAVRHNAYAEWVTYTFSGVASGVYHSCDAGGWCALSYDTLQFLDFWLSFLAVVVTCLYIASLKDGTKAMAQMGTAIVTAAVTKENATSAWNVLVVVLMSSVGLILGWTLDCWHYHLLPTWVHALAPPQSSFSSVRGLYHHLEEFMRQMEKRFHWIHLFTGLGILLVAGLSWILETDDTYWIWHSLWHVCIYSSAFVILSSSCARSKTWALPPCSDNEWVERDHDDDGCGSAGLQEFVSGSCE